MKPFCLYFILKKISSKIQIYISFFIGIEEEEIYSFLLKDFIFLIKRFKIFIR